jgi:glycosyl transferase family 25
MIDRKLQIQHLYRVILGREADKNALNNYLNSNLDLYEIQMLLWQSDEFKNKFIHQVYEPTPLDNKLPIFIVNLDRRPDRKTLIESKLLNLGIKNYEIIKAVDGQTLHEDLSKIYNKEVSLKLNRELKRTEIACALSHIEIAKRIVVNNLDYAIVLEDDTDLTIKFKHFVENFNLESNKFDFLIMGWFSSNQFYNTKLKIKTAPYTVVDSRGITYLDNIEYNIGDISIHKAFYPSLYLDFISASHAYVMSNEGAKKLIELNYPVTLQADNVWNYYIDKCKTVFTYPMIVNNADADSDIENERKTTSFSDYSEIFNNRVNHPDFGT